MAAAILIKAVPWLELSFLTGFSAGFLGALSVAGLYVLYVLLSGTTFGNSAVWFFLMEGGSAVGFGIESWKGWLGKILKSRVTRGEKVGDV